VSLVATRVVLILLAAAALAWLGTGLIAARLESEAHDKLEQPGASVAKQIARLRADRRPLLAAADLLERARKWAPDQAPLAQEAALRWKGGQPRRAVPLLETLISREPKNAEAWYLLSQILARTDPARAASARHRLRELSPPVRGR